MRNQNSHTQPNSPTTSSMQASSSRPINEIQNKLLSSIAPVEEVITNKVDLLNAGDVIKHSILVDNNEDLKSYSHIAGVIKSIHVYTPSGKLYQSYKYKSPDKPVIIKNAEPGVWAVDFI